MQNRKIQWIQIGLAISLLTGAVTGCGSKSPASNKTKAGSQNTSSSSNTEPPKSQWMQVNASSHTVSLKMYGAMNGRLNFNGYANGFMTITVPVNWHVNIQFENKGKLRNSAMIAPLAAVKQKNPPQPAFPGAAVKDANKGIPEGGKESFSFVADKAGKYAIMSGVPGYGTSGMWDHFNVTSAQKPSLTLTHH